MKNKILLNPLLDFNEREITNSYISAYGLPFRDDVKVPNVSNRQAALISEATYPQNPENYPITYDGHGGCLIHYHYTNSQGGVTHLYLEGTQGTGSGGRRICIDAYGLAWD